MVCAEASAIAWIKPGAAILELNDMVGVERGLWPGLAAANAVLDRFAPPPGAGDHHLAPPLVGLEPIAQISSLGVVEPRDEWRQFTQQARQPRQSALHVYRGLLFDGCGEKAVVVRFLTDLTGRSFKPYRAHVCARA